MNIEEFREYCLSLPGAEETMPWAQGRNEHNRGFLVFSVATKWFCVIHVDEFDFCLLKCPPEQAEELRERYEGVRPGWHMNKRHWNSVYFNSDVSDKEIFDLVRLAYETTLSKLPKKLRESIVVEK